MKDEHESIDCRTEEDRCEICRGCMYVPSYDHVAVDKRREQAQRIDRRITHCGHEFCSGIVRRSLLRFSPLNDSYRLYL